MSRANGVRVAVFVGLRDNPKDDPIASPNALQMRLTFRLRGQRPERDEWSAQAEGEALGAAADLLIVTRRA